MAKKIARPTNDHGLEGLDAKTRLLLAAETLFARSGIEGASLREIATKAGQGNHFAVQYHFGDREGLVRALYDYRMLQMEPRRGEMLAAAERADRLKDAKALIEIIFLPQLDLQDADGHISYAGFLSQLLLRNGTGDFEGLGSQFGAFGSELPPNLARTQQYLEQRLDYLPVPVARRRLAGACLLFLNMLVAHHGWKRERQRENFEVALEDTLEQILAGLCMPVRFESGLQSALSA